MGNKGRKFPPEPLSNAEVRQLLAACGGESPLDVRNHALIVVMWRTGLRCAEALALRPSDVNYEDGTIRVLRGKGGKARTVGVDDTTLAVVGIWADTRARVLGDVEGPLFCVIRGRQAGNPLAPRYVRFMIAGLAAKAGIGHRVHPHGLRHSCAVSLAREGWPVPLISRQLGHSNVATTETYMAGIYPAEVVTRARARSW